MSSEKRAEIIGLLMRDKVRAHEILFKHRHPDESAEFHADLIREFHSPEPQVVGEAFRSAAKTTTIEEVFVLGAALQEFHNGLIVASNEELGAQRLAAIKKELEDNEWIEQLVGTLVGTTWGETKIILSNGVCIQAVGKMQSLRGTKHLDWRPDLCLIDDFEDESTVATEAQRTKGLRWLYRTLIPAMAKKYRIRFLGNRLDPDAVIARVSKNPSWKAVRYPIMVRDENGQALDGLPEGKWRATWGSRFPLDWIAAKRKEYIANNILRDFNAEYMCDAEVLEEKPFREDMLRVVPRVRVHEPVQAMIEPLPTVKGKPGLTNGAVWSWHNGKLIVWEAWSRMMMPDEIVGDIVRIDDQYAPMSIGVEEDALKEFLAQPMRNAIFRRGSVIPYLAQKGRIDKDKPDFIRGLQPFFASGNVEFAKEFPELREQLMAQPTGKMDIPSALAFAPWMRPVAPFYEDFMQHHIAEELNVDKSKTRWLAMNASGVMVSAALVQFTDGGVRVLADWMADGDASNNVARILSEASLEAQGRVKPVVCRTHFDRSAQPIGLAYALQRVPVAVTQAYEPHRGREYFRQMLRQQTRGVPMFQVSSEARWTMNALQGGYARAFDKSGQVRDEAQEGPYQLLMEGLESFMAMLRATVETEHEGAMYAESRDGRRYLTSMGAR